MLFNLIANTALTIALFGLQLAYNLFIGSILKYINAALSVVRPNLIFLNPLYLAEALVYFLYYKEDSRVTRLYKLLQEVIKTTLKISPFALLSFLSLIAGIKWIAHTETFKSYYDYAQSYLTIYKYALTVYLKNFATFVYNNPIILIPKNKFEVFLIKKKNAFSKDNKIDEIPLDSPVSAPDQTLMNKRTVHRNIAFGLFTGQPLENLTIQSTPSTEDNKPDHLFFSNTSSNQKVLIPISTDLLEALKKVRAPFLNGPDTRA